MLPDGGRLMETKGGRLRLTIANKRGLHARASAKFVTLVSQYDVQMTVSKEGGEEVDGTSIMGLMMLAAAKGDDILVDASGNDAQPALDAVRELVEGLFGED